jgi:RimJ/RimL family protein N-acetyltransferase
MPGPIEFETQRLRLRQWQTRDLEPFAALNVDRRVMEFFPAPLARAESDQLAERCRSFIAQRGWGLWAVEITDSGRFAGFVGLSVPAPTLPFSPCVEIGWRLAHEHWGKGYASEAAHGALRVGFEAIGLPEIVSFTALVNLRSRAVMERLGMREDPATFEHPNVLAGSPLRTHCLCRLGREEWMARAALPPCMV